MSEDQKLVAEIAARLLLANIEKSGLGRDPALGERALAYARQIVKGARET